VTDHDLSPEGGGYSPTKSEFDMPGLLDDHPLPVSCPKCGAKIQKTVSWLRGNKEMTCPCGTTMHLETAEVLSAVESLETALSRVIRPAPEEAAPVS
jgi:hypothetical protein